MKGQVISVSFTMYQEHLDYLNAEAENGFDGKRSILLRRIIELYRDQKEAKDKKKN